jgi:hypothetical protein
MGKRLVTQKKETRDVFGINEMGRFEMLNVPPILWNLKHYIMIELNFNCATNCDHVCDE